MTTRTCSATVSAVRMHPRKTDFPKFLTLMEYDKSLHTIPSLKLLTSVVPHTPHRPMALLPSRGYFHNRMPIARRSLGPSNLSSPVTPVQNHVAIPLISRPFL
jgi:hypothetical protein